MTTDFDASGRINPIAELADIVAGRTKQRETEKLEDYFRQQWGAYGIDPSIKGIDRATELAQILSAYGITDPTKLGVQTSKYDVTDYGVGGEYGDPTSTTRQALRGQLTYGDKTFGKLGGVGSKGEAGYTQPAEEYMQGVSGDKALRLAQSMAGKGHVNYDVVLDKQGKPVIVPLWESSSDITPELIAGIGLMVAPFTGGLSTALGGGVAGAAGAGALISGGLGALSAASQGEDIFSGAVRGATRGAITGGLSEYTQPFANSIGADVLASTGSQALANAATSAIAAGMGALPQALVTGQFGNVLSSALTAGATSGITSGLSNLTELSPSEISAGAKFVEGATSGNLQKMLDGAAAFTQSPNLAVAARATKLVTTLSKAISSNTMPNMSALLADSKALGQAIDTYSNYYSTTDTGDETERLLKRYPKPDPLRSADYVTQLGNAGLQETPFTLQDLTENLPSVEAGEPQPTGTQMPPQELARFLETNVQDPAELDALMREYYPDMYRGESGETQVIPVVGKKIYPDEEPDRTPGSPWDTSPRGGTTGREDEVIAPTPEPTPAPTQAPTQAPTRAPTRAPAFVGQQTQAPQYAVLDAILAGKMGDPFDPYLLGRPPQDEELQKLLSVLGLNQQG